MLIATWFIATVTIIIINKPIAKLCKHNYK